MLSSCLEIYIGIVRGKTTYPNDVLQMREVPASSRPMLTLPPSAAICFFLISLSIKSTAPCSSNTPNTRDIATLLGGYPDRLKVTLMRRKLASAVNNCVQAGTSDLQVYEIWLLCRGKRTRRRRRQRQISVRWLGLLLVPHVRERCGSAGLVS